MTFERDRLIDHEIATTVELAHSGKPIPRVLERGFGELKPPLVWSAKCRLRPLSECLVPDEPYVDVCQYVRPKPARWLP